VTLVTTRWIRWWFPCAFLVLPGALAASDLHAEGVRIVVDAAHRRQTMEGLGGSLAFWGDRADDKALRYARYGGKWFLTGYSIRL
jgi:hypothetical protein